MSSHIEIRCDMKWGTLRCSSKLALTYPEHSLDELRERALQEAGWAAAGQKDICDMHPQAALAALKGDG